MTRKAVLVWSYFVGLVLYPSYMFAQEPPVETPKLLFDGKTFTLPFEKPVSQKRQIADTLLVGMPIEAYIEPLNLKLSEYKFALPNNPSQTIKRALLIHMANYKGDEEQNALMLRARNNVAQMLNLSGANGRKVLVSVLIRSIISGIGRRLKVLRERG